MCGSLGTLAIVTSATFKLSPVAPFSQTLVATLGDAGRLSALSLALASAPISPTAIELQSPPHRVLVRFETTEAAAQVQTTLAVAICAQHGATTTVVSGQAEVDAWRAHESRIFSEPGTVVKVAVLPTDVADVLTIAQRLTTAASVECAVSGRGALGLVLLRLGGDASAHPAVVTELRREAVTRRGSAVLLAASEAVRKSAGPWGPLGDTGPIMRAVKARFDPHNTLNASLSSWD